MQAAFGKQNVMETLTKNMSLMSFTLYVTSSVLLVTDALDPTNRRNFCAIPQTRLAKDSRIIVDLH